MSRGREQFEAGQQVPGTNYVVKSLIGSGGMGSVYEVEHTTLGKVFVLKALHRHLTSRPDLVARMQNEWRALAKLNHPHIVQVTDAGQSSNGLPYYVMEHLKGETLAQLLSRRGKLPFSAVGPIVVEVLSALGAAHLTGAIHRDVKPQNIFVTEGGTVKLLDFGIAKLRDQVAKVVTAGGVSIGTPRYMAPEQAEGKPVDCRADLYAAGLVLYEGVLGKGPFAHIRDANELVMAHIGQEPERVDFVDPSISPEVADLIAHLLAKSPDARPASAKVAAAQLNALLAALPAVEQDSSEVTLGGAFDASTVGLSVEDPMEVARSVPRSAARTADSDPAPPKEPSSTLTVDPLESLPPAQEQQATTADGSSQLPSSTAPPADPKMKTLGWGTEGQLQTHLPENAQDPAQPSPARRITRTPPPISGDRTQQGGSRAPIWLLAGGATAAAFLATWWVVSWALPGGAPQAGERGDAPDLLESGVAEPSPRGGPAAGAKVSAEPRPPRDGSPEPVPARGDPVPSGRASPAEREASAVTEGSAALEKTAAPAKTAAAAQVKGAPAQPPASTPNKSEVAPAPAPQPTVRPASAPSATPQVVEKTRRSSQKADDGPTPAPWAKSDKNQPMPGSGLW